LDEAIVRHVETNDRLLIGLETAEAAKIACGSAWDLPEPLATDVAGRDRVTGLLRRATLTSDEVRSAMAQAVASIVDAVVQTLESTPPELAADISAGGIVLAGGGALLRGLDRRIAAETNLEVRITDSPLEAVVTGAGATLEETSYLRARSRRAAGRRRRI
jgi:rod shape-determining protein MreB